jgi:hypothetical protein
VVLGNLEQPPVAIDEPCSSGTSRRRLFSPTATQTIECRFSRPLSIGLLFSGLCRGRLDCWVATQQSRRPRHNPERITLATQTSNTLSSHTPRKLKLKQENKLLQNENAHLGKEVEQLRHANNVDNITLEQYKLLTHKFCPSMQLANFINVQVSQAAKLPLTLRIIACVCTSWVQSYIKQFR